MFTSLSKLLAQAVAIEGNGDSFFVVLGNGDIWEVELDEEEGKVYWELVELGQQSH